MRYFDASVVQDQTTAIAALRAENEKLRLTVAALRKDLCVAVVAGFMALCCVAFADPAPEATPAQASSAQAAMQNQDKKKAAASAASNLFSDQDCGLGFRAENLQIEKMGELTVIAGTIRSGVVQHTAPAFLAEIYGADGKKLDEQGFEISDLCAKGQQNFSLTFKGKCDNQIAHCKIKCTDSGVTGLGPDVRGTFDTSRLGQQF